MKLFEARGGGEQPKYDFLKQVRAYGSCRGRDFAASA